MSELEEKQAQLFFPVHLVNTSDDSQADADLVVTLLHHPVRWFESNNARVFEGTCRSKFRHCSDRARTLPRSLPEGLACWIHKRVFRRISSFREIRVDSQRLLSTSNIHGNRVSPGIGIRMPTIKTANQAGGRLDIFAAHHDPSTRNSFQDIYTIWVLPLLILVRRRSSLKICSFIQTLQVSQLMLGNRAAWR